MPIHIPPELRESQLSYIVRGLVDFYADKTITYTQVEESLRRMSEDDLQSILVYSENADFVSIAQAVLAERGVGVSVPTAPFPTPEVKF